MDSGSVKTALNSFLRELVSVREEWILLVLFTMFAGISPLSRKE